MKNNGVNFISPFPQAIPASKKSNEINKKVHQCLYIKCFSQLSAISSLNADVDIEQLDGIFECMTAGTSQRVTNCDIKPQQIDREKFNDLKICAVCSDCLKQSVAMINCTTYDSHHLPHRLNQSIK